MITSKQINVDVHYFVCLWTEPQRTALNWSIRRKVELNGYFIRLQREMSQSVLIKKPPTSNGTKGEGDKRMNSPMRLDHFWRAFCGDVGWSARVSRRGASLWAGPPWRAAAAKHWSVVTTSVCSEQVPPLTTQSQSPLSLQRQSKRGAGSVDRVPAGTATGYLRIVGCRGHGAPRKFTGTLRRVH